MPALRALLRTRPRAVARAGRARWLSRGVAALEFAIVSPLVILVIFFSLEIGIALWADATLEVAASRVSRLGQLGIEEGSSCTEAVREVFEDTMGRWITNKDDLKIDVQIYHPGEPVDFDLGEPVCDAGDRGDMVIYHMAFDRPSFTGILSWLDIPLLKFRRTVLIQNEP